MGIISTKKFDVWVPHECTIKISLLRFPICVLLLKRNENIAKANDYGRWNALLSFSVSNKGWIENWVSGWIIKALKASTIDFYYKK